MDTKEPTVLVVLDGDPLLCQVAKVVTAYGDLTPADLNKLALERLRARRATEHQAA